MPAVNAEHGTPAPTSTRVVLATADPLFAALCQRALAGTTLQLLAGVSPAELMETVRQLAPELILLDADGEDVAALKVLATKVMLVSEARVVVVSAYLAPGSPGLCALLQSVAATFAQKPEGPSSLSLADGDGPAFVAALQAAIAAHEGAPAVAGAGLPVAVDASFDKGWEIDADD